jgi:hypothetical protein
MEAEQAPRLATPDQMRAEEVLAELLRDPDLRNLQAELRREIAETPRAGIPGAEARLDHALSQWTSSLILGEYSACSPEPSILWFAEDAPRTWMGRTVGGTGIAADNPDAVYRASTVDGRGRYEISGRFDPESRPAQFIVEVNSSPLARPWETTPNGPPSIGPTPVALITDKDIAVQADGQFRITMGPGPAAAGHISTPPLSLAILFRDMMADWSQRPSRLSIRRLDPGDPAAFDLKALKRSVIASLPDYVRFWASYPDRWPSAANTITKPSGRPGGWGSVAKIDWRLRADEAILVTTQGAGAAYTGFLVTDPWNMTLDAQHSQASLNLGQSVRSPDGSYTHVISPVDPGVANWLDTGGLTEGYGYRRWQALPADVDFESLVREFRVVTFTELAELDLPRVTPDQRREALDQRAQAYSARWS